MPTEALLTPGMLKLTCLIFAVKETRYEKKEKRKKGYEDVD